MGVDRDESNYALPTTQLIRWVKRALNIDQDRGGPRDIASDRIQTRSSATKRLLKQVTTAVVFLNNTAEEWYRQFLTWYFIRSGYVVIYDRHFYADFYHYHVNGRDSRWTSRLHGYMLEHFLPKPDLVVFLDAPAEILFARKKEGRIELLEERRRDYLELRDKVPAFAVVDATQTEDKVFADVRQLILEKLQTMHTNR